MELPENFFGELVLRMGATALGRRLETQVNHASHFYGGFGRSRFHIENAEWFPWAVDFVLGALRLSDAARRNALDYRLRRLTLRHPAVPEAFDGFTLLHLSDLHADGIPDKGEKLRRLLLATPCDLALVTGDFRYLTYGEYKEATRAARDILLCARHRHGLFGILGNHDFIEMLPGLEAAGMTILLNESASLTRDGQTVSLLGVDDPHFYGAADLGSALRGVPQDAFTILMCHSPEYDAQARQAGIGLFLCGHTHGGQICLPGGRALFINTPCPRRLAAGPWRSGDMFGHTSRGLGVSCFPARFNCPPEATLITLARSEGPPAWTPG
jgi:hypothetical protein